MLSMLLASAFAADPPTQGVILTINAYGNMTAGHVVLDADALAAAGLTFFLEEEPRTGPVVPLTHGMLIRGLPKVGDRLVQDAIDTLMYFDANADGYLDAKDPVFAHLAMFVDRNSDQALQVGEVRKFADMGIEAISRYGSITMKERPSR